ncbi:LOW QUALITY PROTEIN: hypothetical protein N5P37_000518 [Trichoderma harzianum]|nr:LOW QUALITY PROTEIN: hypothetical protein N5P37_000518 [Trichoderma harzianum]
MVILVFGFDHGAVFGCQLEFFWLAMAAATGTAHYIFGNRGVQQEARIMALGTSPSDVDRHHSIIIPLRIHISVQNIFFFYSSPRPRPASCGCSAAADGSYYPGPDYEDEQPASHTEHHGGCSGVYTSSDKHRDRQPSQLYGLRQWQQRLDEGAEGVFGSQDGDCQRPLLPVAKIKQETGLLPARIGKQCIKKSYSTCTLHTRRGSSGRALQIMYRQKICKALHAV